MRLDFTGHAIMRFLGVLVILVAISPIAVADAYNLRRNSNTGELIRWPGATMTLNIDFGSPTVSLISGASSWDQSALRALATWNSQTPFEFRYTQNGFYDACDSNDGVNAADWRTRFCDGMEWGDTLGIAYSSWRGSDLVSVDILMASAPNRCWNDYSGPLDKTCTNGTLLFDFNRVFLHEAGHALGLLHPFEIGQQDVPAVMNYQDQWQLQPDDIEGVRALYGNASFCTPGATESCYTGAPGTAGTGICRAGTRTCRSDGSGFGDCSGQVTPQTEICSNQQDDDCDGALDEGCQPAAQSILQVTSSNRVVMIQKDYGAERWSIAYDRYNGVYLGNVFKSDGSEPSFVWCETIQANGNEIVFRCQGANACRDPSCPGLRADGSPDWVYIGDQTLPTSFFEPRNAAASTSGASALDRDVPASGIAGGGIDHDTATTASAGSILQVTPPGDVVLIQKDYGTERWSIAYDRASGTYLGNVYKQDGSPPSFIACARTGEDSAQITFSCEGADACQSGTCPGYRPDGRPDWVYIGDQTLPRSFFEPRPSTGSNFPPEVLAVTVPDPVVCGPIDAPRSTPYEIVLRDVDSEIVRSERTLVSSTAGNWVPSTSSQLSISPSQQPTTLSIGFSCSAGCGFDAEVVYDLRVFDSAGASSAPYRIVYHVVGPC
ncbi:matrixin family metalloprotease [Candidatus Binatia bacterium]|nr:matrixin family metalloprotease [Candidatus Binatia bacterium]